MVLTWWMPEFAEDLEMTPNRLSLEAPWVRALLYSLWSNGMLLAL